MPQQRPQPCGALSLLFLMRADMRWHTYLLLPMAHYRANKVSMPEKGETREEVQGLSV